MRFIEFTSQKLFEGGNVVIVTDNGQQIPAEKVDLTIVNRGKFTADMNKAFMKINQLFNQKFDKPLWPNLDVFNLGHVFNGSSEAMFNNEIPDSKYIKLKPKIGDIDLTIPYTNKEELWKLCKAMARKSLTNNITYMGDNKSEYKPKVKQINSIFRYEYKPKQFVNVQVDFEFLPYNKKGMPTEFSKFGHSSHQDDLNSGIKGVHHKYILRALVSSRSIRSDIVIMTPASTPAKPRLKKMHSLPRMLTFDINDGIRSAYKKQFLPNGKPWTHNGKPVYKEVSTAESTYEKNLENIFSKFFGDSRNPTDIKKIWSFVGILQLMKQYNNPEQIKNTLMALFNLYWGDKSQELERDDPTLDNKVKMAGYKQVLDVFPNIKSINIKPMKKAFYKYYKMTNGIL